LGNGFAFNFFLLGSSPATIQQEKGIAMFSTHLAPHIPTLNTSFNLTLQQDGGGILPQLDFAGVLILFGVFILLLAIIGPSIRRIAVVEFIEPSKDGTAQKSRGIFGLREQIILGVLGFLLLGFGAIMEVKSSATGFKPTCKDAPQISILKVANVCGCDVSDFGQIQVNTASLYIAGEWINESWSLFNKDQLWAFLIDENTNEILAAKTVGMNPPRWSVTFLLGSEIRGNYKVRLWVLNGKTVKILEENNKDKKDVIMPEGKDNPYYQDILLERVNPDPASPTENCKIPPREE
jgi:hypothetical protein